ncbi:MAG TPA: hypothetical protein VL326_02815 [Kofleriaceae bacterium]|nr:hypothetical protein [Kofleriaceae bacterium]
MAEVIASVPVFRGRRLALAAAATALAGFIGLAVGLVVDPGRTWLSYLMAFWFAFTVAAGALFLLMIGYAANARWLSVVRRTTEAVTLPLPALAVLFVPLLFGLAWLYPWHTPRAGIDPNELAVYRHRAAFLNTPFFAIRGAVYFIVLVFAAWRLRRWSLVRERDPVAVDDPEAALGRERRFASGMLPPVALAFTFANIDWLMSLQGLWYSSMYPVIAFGGAFLAANGAVTLLTERVWTHHTGAGAITRNHFHALGRMLFAFIVFWAYVAFFQVMLIRIANKPEEIMFYVLRVHGAWRVFVWILIAGHFAFPFVLLMPKAIKFRPHAMGIAGGWLVLMHLVDVYWQVIPSHVQGTFVFHWLDLAALAAVLGTCVAVAAWRQDGIGLIPRGDPFLPAGAAYRSPL